MHRDVDRTFTLNAGSRSSGRASSDVSLSQTDGSDGPSDPSGSSQRSKPRVGFGLSLSQFGREVGSLWMKATPKGFHSPRQIANEIRRLRGHAKTTIYERHRRFNDGNKSCPNYRELIPLCMSLVTFPRRASDAEERRAVDTDISKLLVEDPIVYQIFQQCKNEIESNKPQRDIGLFERPDSSDIENARGRWSRLIGYNSFGDYDAESMELNLDELKESIRNDHYAVIDYLPYVLATKMQGKDLELLQELWDHFLSCVVEFGYPIWMNVMDSCFKNIVSSGKPLAKFASPLQLKSIASYLVKYQYEAPFIFSSFFAVPTIELESKTSPYAAKFVYPAPFGDWDLVTASSYAVHFLRNKAFKTIVPNPESHLRTYAFELVKNTVLLDSRWMMLYRIVQGAVSNYRHANGVVRNVKRLKGVHPDLSLLMDDVLLPFMYLDTKNSKYTKEKSRSKFFISQSVDIDRYYKLEMLEAYETNIEYSQYAVDRERFQTYIRIPGGIYSLTFIPQFRNVPYLRRFRIGGKYFITADGLPEPIAHIWSPWNRENFLEDLAVDTMFLDGHLLTLLHIHDKTPFFDCTGHYPILAGYEMGTRDPFYIAVARLKPDSPWYFTTIKDGASSVKYTDEDGEEHIKSDFFVLALRHDPTDIPPPPYSHLRKGAKDPTGPVYWLKYWPHKDSQYADREVPSDDRLLEPFLNALRERKRTEQSLVELLSGFD
ncbi:hypothetical protein SCHPADRAFT_931694 [Schizopora paradoxa]|uniref:Uncharacterized protein n=1 Tax=Schizopora paradoxa TaxID=27342 RepID=A0A0H2R9S9_9AGAM|nr:hypothetical protein SCHPADRAFT_931694 [Schizopora paradoxa]